MKSICGCLVYNSNTTPEPYPHTHPIRPMQLGYSEKHVKNYVIYGIVINIKNHELSCEKALAIKDGILDHQNLDGPYLCD